jgi:hypothetical protein
MKEQVLEEILNNIESVDDFQTKIEILANIFIRVGLGAMDVPKGKHFNTENVLSFVMDDIEKNGEHTANAVVRQGLLILTWLNKEKL